MTTTLLIDLDDTLLSNDMDRFLPAYLQALSAHLAPYAAPKAMVRTLLEATQEMVANRRPDCRLIEVFEAAFYPALGLDANMLRQALDSFYAEIFPSLEKLTHPRPEAAALVTAAFERGYRVAIATNPLFPRPAILHRLRWAGLAPEQYPFDLITSVEQFHFAKPHPAYLAECLGYLGWPDGAVVMVGDNPVNDIRPARALGLATFQASPGNGWQAGEPEERSAGGSLSGLLPWLDGQPEESLLPQYTNPEAVLAVLQATPAILDGSLRDRTAEAWAQRPQAGEWNPVEILCHLRDVEEEVNLPRLQKALAEQNPFLPGMDTDPWAEERRYFCQDGPQALHRFTSARLKLLDLLAGLPPQDWERPVRHAILGPTRLGELAGIIASHDRLHVRQVLGGIR